MAIRFDNNRRQYMSEKMEKINRLKQSLENAESEISGLKNKVSEQNSTAEKNEKILTFSEPVASSKSGITKHINKRKK